MLFKKKSFLILLLCIGASYLVSAGCECMEEKYSDSDSNKEDGPYLDAPKSASFSMGENQFLMSAATQSFYVHQSLRNDNYPSESGEEASFSKEDKEVAVFINKLHEAKATTEREFILRSSRRVSENQQDRDNKKKLERNKMSGKIHATQQSANLIQSLEKKDTAHAKK